MCVPENVHTPPVAGLEISTRPLAQASVKTTWASTNPRVFVAFIKGTRPMASAVKLCFHTCIERFYGLNTPMFQTSKNLPLA